MATGILSVAAQLERLETLSIVLLLTAIGVFIGVAATDLLVARPALRVFVLLTFVAACGVLSQGLARVWAPATVALAVLAVAGFAAALVVITRSTRGRIRDWRSWPVSGSWLLGTVAVQSLATLAASPARSVAIALWVIGMAVYLVLITLIIRRLLHGSPRIDELTPDYWIAMGALAISSVALHAITGRATVLEVAVWAAGAAWIPFLLVAEALKARIHRFDLRHDLLRWSTVFPLGMLSVGTHDAGLAPIIATAAFWAGLAVALANAALALRGSADS